jgi:hypothetical protein
MSETALCLGVLGLICGILFAWVADDIQEYRDRQNLLRTLHERLAPLRGRPGRWGPQGWEPGVSRDAPHSHHAGEDRCTRGSNDLGSKTPQTEACDTGGRVPECGDNAQQPVP